MPGKWSKAQHAKFQRTIRRKQRDARLSPRQEIHYPIPILPARAAGLGDFGVEIKAGSEITFIVRGTRITMRAT